MKYLRQIVCAAAACAAASAQTAAPAPSASTGDETVQLPQFTVSSTKANAYRATDSLSAARTGGPILDTPAMVNVITRDFLDDIGANSIFDATQYVSGISQGRLGGANGIAERQSIRGFENNGRTIDDFGTGFQAEVDPAFIQRVEIVKGPDAILAPTGTPGGSLNVITKSPQFTPDSWASFELGNYFSQKLTMDSTGPLGEGGHAAYRVVAAGEDGETFVPGRLKQWDVNPELTYRFSEHAQLTVKYSMIDWRSEGGASNPGTVWIVPDSVANGAVAPTTPAPGFAYRGENGVPDWAVRSDQVQRAAAEFTSALGDRVNMRLGGQFVYDHMNIDGGQDAFPSQNARYDPYTGIYTPDETWALNAAGTYVPTVSAEYDPTNVARTAQISPVWTHDAQVQNDYAGNFQTGPLSLRPLVGGTYEHTLSSTYNETAALPAINLFAPNNDPVHPPQSAYATSGDSMTNTTDKQVYAFNRFGLVDDKVFATAGWSRVWINTSTHNLLNGVVTSLRGAQDTYLDGLLVKPASNVSLYGSYSTNAALANFNNQPLWQQGKQWEFGVKSEFFDQRLSISADHFQIAQSNLVTPNPVFLADPVHNPVSLLADETNRGYELDVEGGLTPEISVLASATSMKTRDAFGRRPRNIPDTMANLLVKYDFRDGALKGFGAFLGLNYLGTVAGENPISSGTQLGVIEQVSFYLPSRTILNGGLVYRTGRYRLNLNVDNLLDDKTVFQASGRFNLSPYATTTVRLTTTVNF